MQKVAHEEFFSIDASRSDIQPDEFQRAKKFGLVFDCLRAYFFLGVRNYEKLFVSH